MKFNAAEFIAFAQFAQDRDWKTKKGLQFSYEVINSGICLLPESGKKRNISNSEILKFCKIFSETQSKLTSDYKELFNKSYLLAIAIEYCTQGNE
ncbi:hypothetical protein JCM14076_24790 [Methylosoma difficile]